MELGGSIRTEHTKVWLICRPIFAFAYLCFHRRQTNNLEDTSFSGKHKTTMSRPQLSTIVPQTSRPNERGNIRRGIKGKNPELGYKGCRTLYEGFRYGHSLNPLGACLGFRAISTNGLATPYIYSSYTEVLARVNAFAAGLETLNLVPPTQEDGMVLLGLYMKNCMEWFIGEQAVFCVAGATGESNFEENKRMSFFQKENPFQLIVILFLNDFGLR